MHTDFRHCLGKVKALPNRRDYTLNKAMPKVANRPTGPSAAMAEKLREAMADKGISKAELARECGVKEPSVYDWLEFGRVAKRHLPTFVRVFGKPLEWWLDMPAADRQPGALPRQARQAGSSETGGSPILEFHPVSLSDTRTDRVPVRGVALLGDDGYFEVVGGAGGVVRYPTRDSEGYALRVKGDGLRPRIKSGEFVVIEPQSSINPGDEVLIRTRSGRSMLKVLHSRRAGQVELLSINEDQRPSTLDEADIEHLHYVAGILKHVHHEPE